MSSYKTRAIVLKSYKLGESDKIIKMFSLKEGIVSAVAKGSRKIKSKFGGRLELFNFVDLELARGKNLDIITSVEILKNFRSIPLDFNKYIIGELIGEIILKTQSAGTEISPLLFKLIYICFNEIDNLLNPDEYSIKKIACFFGAKFLKITGFHPVIENCSRCGTNINGTGFFTEENVLFSIKNGGIVCRSCASNPRESLEIKILTVENYFFLKDLFQKKIKDLRSMDVKPESVQKLYKLIGEYIEYHTDCSLDSFGYLNRVV